MLKVLLCEQRTYDALNYKSRFGYEKKDEPHVLQGDRWLVFRTSA